MHNRSTITKLLETNDRAVARALVVLNQRQTADEQQAEQTKYTNGRGFRSCDARMGTSMAQFYERNGYLSPKQLAYWRKRQRNGVMRICVYANQLADIANQKHVDMVPG